MTFQEHSIKRRQRLLSFCTVDDIVYGAIGPILKNPSNHSFDNHFSLLNASYSEALPDAAKKLAPIFEDFYTTRPLDFEDLFSKVKEVIGGIHGIGELAIYDISLRLGWSLTPKVIPLKYVYTHGNIVEESAKALLPGVKIENHRIDSSLFSAMIPHYSAMEIESILCIYHQKIMESKGFDLKWLEQCPE